MYSAKLIWKLFNDSLIESKLLLLRISKGRLKEKLFDDMPALLAHLSQSRSPFIVRVVLYIQTHRCGCTYVLCIRLSSFLTHTAMDLYLSSSSCDGGY